MQTPNEAPPPAPLEETVDLFDLAVRFVTQWRRIVGVALVVFALCAAIIYSIKPQFEAAASILPQGDQSASSASSLFSTHSPGDVFIGLLSSRTVADDVIDRVGLMQVYRTTSREKARGSLGASSVFSYGKDTLVVIKVRASDSDLARRIANAYLDALQTQREQALTHQAEIRDRFLQQQISIQADALAAAEQDLKLTQQKTGVVQPEAQTTIGLNAIAVIQTQITALQVQLATVRLGATDQNPLVQDLESQIAALTAKEHTLESANSAAPAGAASSAREMPELNLDYARKLRQVRFHETLLTSISNQYQNSRLSEGNAASPFLVIDSAIAPEVKAWPPRKLLLIFAFVFSAIVGVVFAIVTLLYRRLMSDPVQVTRIQQLRASFKARP